MLRTQLQKWFGKPSRPTRHRGSWFRPGLESLEERILMTLQPVTLTDPSFWGVTGFGLSENVSMSADGQRIVFESNAENLVPNDTNGTKDVFLFDRGTNRVSLVSVNRAGTVSADRGGFAPVISADGRYVAFLSDAADIDANGTPVNNFFQGQPDVYVRDLTTGKTYLMSSWFDGSRDSENVCSNISLATTPDGGCVVVWDTPSPSMVAGDTNNRTDVFARKLNPDGTRGATQLVSVGTDGSQGNGASYYGRISTNGRFVAFESVASNFDSLDHNGLEDVFVRDLLNNTTTMVSVDQFGVSGAGHNRIQTTDGRVISDDGRFVVFHSQANGLVQGVTGNHVYIRDTIAGTTRLLDAIDTTGLSPGNGESYRPTLTPDGRFAAFVSFSTNLVTGTTDSNNNADVFVRDLFTGTNYLISADTTGRATGNGPSGLNSTGSLAAPILSADGRFIAFASDASNLVAGDANGQRDVFVRDRIGETTTLVSRKHGGTGSGNNSSYNPALSADGTVVAFTSTADDLIAGDGNRVADVFTRNLTTGTTGAASLRSPLLPAAVLAPEGGHLLATTPDGRFTVFTSSSGETLTPNVPGVGGAFVTYLFVRDNQTGAVQLASVRPNGSVPGTFGGGSFPAASISADGRYLAFLADQHNLDAGVTGTNGGFYIRDLQDGVTTMISRNSATGAPMNNFHGNDTLTISQDGRYVAFTSFATNLINGITVTGSQLYLFDRNTNMLRLVSAATNGTQGGDNNPNQGDYRPQFSADGSRLVFSSRSTNLVAGVTDTNNANDVFAYDLTGPNAFQVQLVSVSTTAGTTGNNFSGGTFYSPDISDDGRYVAFASRASNLVSGPVNSAVNVYRRDLQTGSTVLVSSIFPGGTESNRNAQGPQISGDGSRVLFQSSNRLNDQNAALVEQLWVRDFTANTLTLVSRNTAGTMGGNDYSGHVGSNYESPAQFTADGRYVAFLSLATNLVPGLVDGNGGGRPDLYLHDLQTGLTTLVTFNNSGTGSTNGTSFIYFRLTTGGGVVFESNGSDLVNGDRNKIGLFNNNNPDVFVFTNRGGVATLSGKLFRDDNANGTQDGAETGLPFGTLYLDANNNGQFDLGEQNVQTDIVGNYRFTNLAAGTYTVRLAPLPGMMQTAPLNPNSYTVTLATATSGVTNRDFGVVVPVPDLEVDSVTAPANAPLARTVTVSWRVRSLTNVPAVGDWQDAVYLSANSVLDSSAQLVALVPHTGGLAGNDSYNGSATFALPDVMAGSYYIFVQTDRRYQLRDETNRVNNIAVSGMPVNITVPVLTAGTPITDAFSGPNQDHYFQIMVAPGQTLRFNLASAAASGGVELYVRRAALPTPYAFDLVGRASGPNQSVTVATTEPGTYFVLVRSRFGTAATAGYTLTASLPGFALQSLSPIAGGNTGRVTVTLDGSNFTNATTAHLVNAGITLDAVTVTRVDASRLLATFDLTDKTVGAYDVRVVDGNQSATLSGAFQVVAGTAPRIETQLIGPAAVRAGRNYVFYIEVANRGNTNVDAPMLTLFSPTLTLMGLTPENQSRTRNKTFLAGPTDPREGLELAPGEVRRYPIYFVAPDAGEPYNFRLLYTTTNEPSLIDFPFIEENYIIDQFKNRSDWPTLRTAVQTALGPTWGDFVTALNRAASLLPPEMAPGTDAIAALNLAIDRVIADRSTSLGGVVRTTDPRAQTVGRMLLARNTATGEVAVATILRDGSFLIPEIAAGQYVLTVDGLRNVSPVIVNVADQQKVRNVTVNVGQGAVLHGTLRRTEPDALPIANALIRVTGPDGRQVSTTTDAQGNYRLEGLISGVFNLVIDAAGRARTIVNNLTVSGGYNEVELTAGPEATIFGTVTLEAGGPTGGALEVLILPNDGTDPILATGVSSTTNQFTVGRLAAGTYDVQIKRDGYITLRLEDIVVPNAGAVDLGSLNLLRTSIIRGSVVSDNPNVSYANAVVGVLDGTTLVAVAISNNVGNFTARDLRPGTYTLRLLTNAFNVTEPTVTVGLGETVTGVTITAGAGATITGRVVDATNNPLAGVTVLLQQGTDAGPVPLTTHNDGSYSLSGLPIGTYTLSLPVAGAGSSQSVNVTNPDGTVTVPDLQLAYAGRIHGTLRRADATPVTSGVVMVVQGGDMVLAADVGADGRYAFLFTQPGVFDLVAVSEGQSFSAVSGVAVAAGANVQQDFTAGTGAIQITLTDGGQPAAGATASLLFETTGVRVAAGLTTTGADGVAHFTGLAPGTYRVEVVATGNRAARVTDVVVTADTTTPLPMSLAARSRVTGRVTGPGGAGLDGAVVELVSTTPGAAFQIQNTQSDGTYDIGLLPPGTYDIVVRAKGMESALLTNVAVNGNAIVDVTLNVSTTTLTGRLVDAVGRPIPGATVLVQDAAEHTLALGQSRADGTFTVEGVVGVNLEVLLAADGYALATVEGVAVVAGQNGSLGDRVLQAVASAQTSVVEDPGSGRNVAALQSEDGQESLPPSREVERQLNHQRDIAARLKASLRDTVRDVSRQGLAYAASVEEEIQFTRHGLEDRLKELPNAPSGDCPSEECIRLYQQLQRYFNEQERQAKILEDAADATDVQKALLSAAFLTDLTGFFGPFLLLTPATGVAAAVITGASIGLTLAGTVLAARDATDPGQAKNLFTNFNNLANNLLTGIPASVLAFFPGATAARAALGFGAAGAGINAGLTISGGNFFALTVAGIDKLEKANAEMNQAFEEFVVIKTLVRFLNQRYLECMAKEKASGNDCECKTCNPVPPDPRPVFPPPPNGGDGGGTGGTSSGSFDPNDIVGYAGFGSQRFVTTQQTLPYTVRFENDPVRATAPALDVVITHQLDTNLDWSTFQLGALGFGDEVIEVPAGVQVFQTTVAYRNADTSPLTVTVDARLDLATGVVTWTFRSIDPATGLSPDAVTAGFLPPNDVTHRGEGFVTFTVQPRTNLATGMAVNAQASIVFDTNAPLETNIFTNTIDATAPTSSVQPLPAVSQLTAIPVTWSGTDQPNGSGIASYDIFVAIDNGPWQLWLDNTTQTSSTYLGQLGHTYAFYSVATDNVGLMELSSAVAQAVISLQLPLHTSPSIPSIPQARIVQPVLVGLIRQGKGSKTKQAGRVQFSDGTTRVILSPYQKPRFRAIAATLIDANGDGTADSIRFTARLGTKMVSRIFVL